MTAVRLPTLLAACALGGALGSALRWAIDEGWPGPATTWPWATFTVNVVGCLLLGLLLGSPLGQDPVRRAFLGAGVLGGFTTFSTYALQVHVMTDDGHGRTAAGYAVGSVLACLLAAHAGRRWAERHDELTPADEQGDA